MVGLICYVFWLNVHLDVRVSFQLNLIQFAAESVEFNWELHLVTLL